MRVVFMGTPSFACPSLEALQEANYEILGVFTQPDKPARRGQKLTAPPVKELALERHLPVYQPQSLSDEGVIAQIKALAPDIIIVVAYGKLLPQEVLDIAPYGAINVHGSILPKYRGAAPIQWAVLNGETKTGITIMQMDKGLDTGDMLSVWETDILAQETAGELFERLSVQGAKCLIETLEQIKAGQLSPVPQDDSRSSYAPQLRKEDSAVNWAKSAQEIHNQIRGLNPWPMATGEVAGRGFKFHKARVGERKGAPGQVLQADKHGIEVACGQGSVCIEILQAAGKRAMTAEEYLRGNPIE